ncbi:hypothetical protein GCM10027162_66500 [Streptomyces incanus]
MPAILAPRRDRGTPLRPPGRRAVHEGVPAGVRNGVRGGSCPASWRGGSSVARSGTRPLPISQEAAVHKAPR